jgi:uncharacterized metal-binding protein YceD (DUF177 family)
MLTFKINEIRQGESTEIVALAPGMPDTAPYPLLSGVCKLHFNRRADRIRVTLTIEAEVELVCDRSGDSFPFPVNATYNVVFDSALKEDLEDESGASRVLHLGRNEMSLEQDVRDTILLEIPLKKIHPRFRRDYDEGEEIVQVYSDPDIIDPRWEALKKLNSQNN